MCCDVCFIIIIRVKFVYIEYHLIFFCTFVGSMYRLIISHYKFIISVFVIAHSQDSSTERPYLLYDMTEVNIPDDI